MHGLLQYPTLVSGLPARVLNPDACDIATAAVPNLRHWYDASDDWYLDGPFGLAWYSKILRDRDSNNFDRPCWLRPYSGFLGEDGAPTFTAGGIGDGDSLLFDGFYNSLVHPLGQQFRADTAADPAYDQMNVALAEGFVFFAIKTTTNQVTQYIIAPPSQPAATFLTATRVPYIKLTAAGGGATQTVTVLNGNGGTLLGGNSTDHKITTAGTIMLTWGPVQGRRLWINGIEVDTEGADTAAMDSGRFQLGRRSVSPYTGTPPSEVYTAFSGHMGRFLAGDVDISAAAYDTIRDNLFVETHTKWGGAGGLPVFTP